MPLHGLLATTTANTAATKSIIVALGLIFVSRDSGLISLFFIIKGAYIRKKYPEAKVSDLLQSLIV